MADSDFFTRLYSGFEAEHFVTGKIFGAGLEAFKLPADFGFDLLVSNQKEASLPSKKAPVERVLQFPYTIQVKSRRIPEDILTRNLSGRLEAKVDFTISESEFELLKNEKSSFLACVAFPPPKKTILGDQILYFWLQGSQLEQLQQYDFLYEIKKNTKVLFGLTVGFRFLPTESRNKLLDDLTTAHGLNPDQRQFLETRLPDSLGTTSGSEYVSLYRRSFRENNGKRDYFGNRETGKMLHTAQLDFAKMGIAVDFPTREF